MQVPFEYYVMALSMLAGFAMRPRRNIPLYLQLFPFFLLITLANEIISWQLGLQSIPNIAFNNFYSVGAFCFYMYILREVIFTRWARKAIIFLMIAYAIGSVCNILFIQGIDTFHTITYSLGCFMIVAISIFYFLELFQVPRSVDLKKEPSFWIVSGLLFYYACTPAILGVINYLSSFPDISPEALLLLITVLNVSLYSLFTIAFLCRINFRRSMSSS